MTDNNDNVPITPFSEFVDSVFTELNSPTNEWYADLSNYGYNYYNPTYWENALIPLAIRIYELAQNDDTIYWWLLRKMSLVDLCKASKEDFRKREVFDVLLQLKPEHRRVILENCVPKHAEELQEALDTDALETFRSLLPLIDNDDTIYNISRVLMRVNEVRVIFERTIHYTKGDSLGILFVLLREYYYYFAGEYNYNSRYCDGLANNVFLALYQTQYREAKVEFCHVATEIGELWVKNLILDYFLNKDHMPKSVGDVLNNILQSKSHYVYHDLENALTFCDKDEQTEDFRKRVGGWLDLEKYTVTFSVFDREWIKTLPPFSCRCLNERRRVRRSVQRNGNEEHSNVQDNCIPYIDSKKAIPLEDLKTLKAQEANKNIEIQEPVAVPDCNPKPTAKGKGHGVMNETKEPVNYFKPIPFPDTLDIAPATPKLFLEVLYSKLVSAKFLASDSVNDFIFILGGAEDDANDSRHVVDWNLDRPSLQAFCSAFYDFPNYKGRKPWSTLTKLFTLSGQPIEKLSENANQVYGKDLESRMKWLIESAIDDAKIKAQDSVQK